MKYLLKRAIILVLLLSLIWFGSILAAKNCLHQGVIRLHIFSQPDVPISSELVSSIRTIVSEFFTGKISEICRSNGTEMCISVDLPELEQQIKALLSNLNKEISVYWNRTKNTELEDAVLNLPSGVFHTVEIHIGEMNEDVNCVKTLLDPVFRENDISSILEDLDSAEYVVLNYLGFLENIFYME